MAQSVSDFPNSRRAVGSVTIANGASLSGSIYIGGTVPVAVVMPAAWTAAGLSFQGSADGINFYDLQTSSAELTATAAASQMVAIDPANFKGCVSIKVRSGASGSAVNQLADRMLTLVFLPVEIA